MSPTLPPTDARPARPAGETYEQLLLDHRQALSRLALRLTGNPEDSQDLLQETLIDAYRSFHRFEPGSRFYNWMARIMTNNHLDRVRRRRWTCLSLDAAADPDAFEFPDPAANPEREVVGAAMEEAFAQALGSLNAEQRATVLLCDLNGASYEEAATAQACPVGTIRSRLHRAHKALAELLENFSPHRPQTPEPEPRPSRRSFLRMGTAAAGAAIAGVTPRPAAAADRTWVLWTSSDPREPAYPEGLAATLAGRMRTLAGGRITPLVGPAAEPALRRAVPSAGVLVLWMEEGDAEPGRETVDLIRRRVRHDGMGLLLLHAAADSAVLSSILGEETPWRRRRGEVVSAEFRLAAPRHPVVQGIPSAPRLLAHQQCEDESRPPRPGVVLLDQRPEGDAASWQAVSWEAGEGRVVYLEPGHGTLPVYSGELMGRLLQQSLDWLDPTAGA